MHRPALALVAFLGLVAPAHAYSERPMVLPGQATASAARDWLIGARAGERTNRIAARHGAEALDVPGAFRVPAARARSLAAELRRASLLTYAEPDARLERASSLESAPDKWARPAVVATGLVPPADLPRIGVIDDFIDPRHPDVGPQTQYLNATPEAVIAGPHGTMVASAAAAAADGSGVVGITPGAPLASYGLGTEITCGDAADGLAAMTRARVPIVNLSVGGEDCFTMFRAVQIAYGAGQLVVAAAGNEFAAGNPVQYPAAYPHVMSVAAVDPDLKPSYFSTSNLAVDIAAPGSAVPLSIPTEFDTVDGVQDGVTVSDGTSFAAPMVAGVAAWLSAARPTLANGQVADILRRSAVDLSAPGYDRDTGFGLVNVQRALAEPTPRIDPLEPNDGITFVDGTAFSRPDPPIWRGGARRVLRATADLVEDPVDVYRVRVPGRTAFSVRVRPRAGNPDLVVFSSRAKAIDDARHVVAESKRGPGRTESVRLVNGARSARGAYVMVEVSAARGSALDTAYTLEVLKVRRR